MFKFFRQVIAFIKLIIQLIDMLFKGLLTLLELIPKGLLFLVEAIAYMPPLVTAFAMAAIMISVTFLILGRTGKT